MKAIVKVGNLMPGWNGVGWMFEQEIGKGITETDIYQDFKYNLHID